MITVADFGNVYSAGRQLGNVAERSELGQSVSMSFIPPTTAGRITDFWGETMNGVYLSDGVEREFAFYGSSSFQTYTISSGTVSLTSTTTGIPNQKLYGLKKISGMLYVGYYYEHPSIKKISIVPGSTSEISTVYTFSETSFPKIIVIEKKIYFGFDALSGNNFFIKIYSFDMKSETMKVVVNKSLVAYSANLLPLAYSMGELVWAALYVVKGDQGACVTALRVIGSMCDSTLLGAWSDPHDYHTPCYLPQFGITVGNTIQYNSKDYVLQGGTSWTDPHVLQPEDFIVDVKITPQGISTYGVGDAPVFEVPKVIFSSKHKFPALGVGYAPNYDYHWLNPATGQSIGTLNIDGVNNADIYTIFPTLDSITENIYISAKVDGVDKIISISPYGNKINQTINVSLSNYMAEGFNHGNFFVLEYDYDLRPPRIVYLTENLVQHITSIQMIPEMN